MNIIDYNIIDMYMRVLEQKNRDGRVRKYLYIAETYRDGNRVRQRLLLSLGRLDRLLNTGTIDKFIEKLAELSKRKEIIDMERDIWAENSKEWGAVYVFKRLWKESGLEKIFKAMIEKKKMGYDFVEAVFQMVLNRLTSPFSKRRMFLEWKEDYYWEREDGLSLHHYYRALSILSSVIERVEEILYGYGRNLFTSPPELVLFDTTTTYFEGEGSSSLLEYGYSKDHRSDRKQVVIGLVMREEGLPIMHKVFEGNKIDLKIFREVVKELKVRFGIKKVILVADRGCIDEKLIGELEEMKMGYIVGVRMRKLKEVKEEVLSRGGKYKEVSEKLKVKEVWVKGKRYIVCLNEKERIREKEEREEMIKKLKEKIEKDPKGLINNRGYRRFLKLEKRPIEIDEQRLKEEERYDGKWVIRTNSKLEKGEVGEAYKGLWRVERAFRELKDVLKVRPVYHWNEERIKGHIAVCFLALYLEMYLLLKIERKRSFEKVMWEISKMKAVELKVKGEKYLLRTEVPKEAVEVFKFLKIGLPKRVKRL